MIFDSMGIALIFARVVSMTRSHTLWRRYFRKRISMIIDLLLVALFLIVCYIIPLFLLKMWNNEDPN